jgi:hypothetical protein
MFQNVRYNCVLYLVYFDHSWEAESVIICTWSSLYNGISMVKEDANTE